MIRTRTAAVLTAGFVACTSYSLRADVRTDEKTHVEFGGVLGRMANVFGGRRAREGVMSTVAVRGERKARLNDTTGQIIDLSEEKIYDLDIKRKTFKVTTFAELRRRMEEAQKKAEEEARQQEGKGHESTRPEKERPQVEIDVDVRNTGQTKTVNGFNTRESIITVTVREKGKTLEQGGGLVLVSDAWLAPKVEAMKEVAGFDVKYAQKLYGQMFGDVSAEQMAAAMAMYPAMKQALGRMSSEGAKVEGTPIVTTVTMEAVKSEEQMAEEARQSESSSDKPGVSGGVGGFVGGLARRAAAKKMSGGDAASKQRATVMTSTTEVLKIATDVNAADVGVPVGFKETR